MVPIIKRNHPSSTKATPRRFSLGSRALACACVLGVKPMQICVLPPSSPHHHLLTNSISLSLSDYAPFSRSV